MKKKFLLLAMISMISAAFVSCDKDDVEDENNNNTTTGDLGNDVVYPTIHYMGTMNVINADGSIYTNSAAECGVMKHIDMDLILLNAKMAERMPALDSISVRGIPYTDEDGKSKFEVASIVPYFKGNAFTQYTITGMKGFVSQDSLVFSAQMGSYPIEYKGLKK